MVGAGCCTERGTLEDCRCSLLLGTGLYTEAVEVMDSCSDRWVGKSESLRMLKAGRPAVAGVLRQERGGSQGLLQCQKCR